MALGIRALFSFGDFVGQDAFEGFSQQPFFSASVSLEFPGNVVGLFHNPRVAEWYADFKAAVHTHSVLPVKKRLHKPAVVEIHHLLGLPFFRRFLW